MNQRKPYFHGGDMLNYTETNQVNNKLKKKNFNISKVAYAIKKINL